MTDIDRLRTTVESIPLFDSHSHTASFGFGTPLNDRHGRSLPQILVSDYLWYLAGSCSSADPMADPGRKWQVPDAEAHFRAIQPLLEQCRGLSTYAVPREGIRELFSFHPLLLDTLYSRWGSHPDFPRTRGVLRLLASVVGDLWQRREGNTQTQHLIQPCHLRWSIDALPSALTRLWGGGYQAIVAADILAEKSSSSAFDQERGTDYQREAIGQGLASAILLGSFGGRAERSGFSPRDLKLACCKRGLNWNYLDGALLELDNRCFHLHSTAAGSLGKRYWFSTKPSLNKLLVQYRQQVASRDFDEDILEALKTQSQQGGGLSGATWQVRVNPEPDLPEQKALTLLILPPSVAWGNSDSSQEVVDCPLSDACARFADHLAYLWKTLVEEQEPERNRLIAKAAPRLLPRRRRSADLPSGALFPWGTTANFPDAL
jgi:hypothetical protein